MSLRATVRGAMKKPPLERIARGARTPPASAGRGRRSAYFAEVGKAVPTPTYARDDLRAGNRIDGPALVEEHASTTVVLPEDRLQVDGYFFHSANTVPNPTALLQSAVLMLHHLEEEAAANKVQKALETVYSEKKCLTRDVGGHCGTTEFADAILAAMERQ